MPIDHTRPEADDENQSDKSGPPKDFRPEGAEFEPAGGILKKPPAPEEPIDKPVEGDKR